jgi:predicted regulator of amino acid metabolism with ACT domain
MWKTIAKYFNKYPQRQKLAQKFLEYGLKIMDNKVYCGEIQLTDTKISRAFHVDRRIISSTIETIMERGELKKVFSKLKPTCNLREVAPAMNWGVIEIVPEDPSRRGILAEVSSIVANADINIRQAIVDDFELSEEPKLFIVAEKQIPGKLIPEIRKAKGVKAVIVY